MTTFIEELRDSYEEHTRQVIDAIARKIEGWKLTDYDKKNWTLHNGKKASQAYFDGYEAGVESVKGLLYLILEDEQ